MINGIANYPTCCPRMAYPGASWHYLFDFFYGKLVKNQDLQCFNIYFIENLRQKDFIRKSESAISSLYR